MTIFKFHQYIFTISKLSPLEKGRALHLNPLYPKMIRAKFGWNWPSGSGEEDFLEFVNVFLQFCNYLPLASLVKIGPVVLEKKMKMWNFYNNNNKDFDDGHQTNFVQKSSLESSVQVSWKKFQRRIFLSEVISNLAFDL